MQLRADHVAGAFFVAIGLLVIALSGDLPVGRASMPGAGFIPLLIAVLIIILGGALFVRAGESKPFSAIDWSDGKHALSVLAVTVAAVALYVPLGFVITLILMMVVLLVGIERRNIVYAVLYSTLTVTTTYVVFTYMLQLPLPGGVLGY